jgi:hypothetical protein
MANDKPNAQQTKFAQIYSETNDAILAYKTAYPENAAKAKYLNSSAYHKLDNPKVKALIDEIQQGLRAQFIMLAPEALDQLVNLANNAESEKVKLEANKEILYGAGLRPPEQIEMKQVGMFGGASPEAIRDMIRAQLDMEEEPIKEEVTA